MRIYLCRGYIYMTQHDLYGTQVCPALQKVAGKGMTKTVGRYLFIEGRSDGIAFEQFPETLAGHRFACPGDKKILTG